MNTSLGLSLIVAILLFAAAAAWLTPLVTERAYSAITAQYETLNRL